MGNRIRIKQSIVITALKACLCLLPAGSAAKSEDPLLRQLPTTLVSAPRFMDVDINIASRVQVIDQLAIEKSGATNMVELLKTEANLHFRSSSGNAANSEISMGGFGENSGQRVLILLDGQRLNTADLGQINWLSIPLGLIGSVEVIKGGQSALYGNNATGGVIKIKTRRPTDEISGQTQVSLGSFDSYNGRVALTGSEGNLGFSVHAEHDETAGYRENSQYEADAGGLKLTWASEDWLSGFVSISTVESEYGLPGPLTRSELAENFKQSTEGSNYGEEKTAYFRFGVGLSLNDQFSLDLSGGSVFKEVYALYLDPFSSESQTDYDLHAFNPVLRYAGEIITASAGLDYFKDAIEVNASYGNADFDRETMAVFGSWRMDLSEALNLTASIRLASAQTDGVQNGVKLEQVDDEHYAWSLGLVQQIGDKARVYGSARRFFRYASTDELIQYLPPAYSPTTNFDLNAEKGHELEIGSDWIYGALSLGGRMFYQWMNDEIIYNGGSGNINLDQTRRVGADLDMKYRFSEMLSLMFSYTWVQAEFNGGAYDGSFVPLVPEHKLRLALKYRPSAPITLTFGASYTDAVFVGGDFANTAATLDNYILFDLSARYALSENLELFITADNLFDKRYISTAFAPDALYPGTGRSGRIGVIWEF